MKSKITIISIIINVLLFAIIIYQSLTYTKIPKQYECETEELIEENTTSKQIIVININNDQYVKSYQNKNVIIYDNLEQYNLAKDIPSTDDVSYEFDDKNNKIIVEYKENQVTDSNGNLVEVWYKEYIKKYRIIRLYMQNEEMNIKFFFSI